MWSGLAALAVEPAGSCPFFAAARIQSHLEAPTGLARGLASRGHRQCLPRVRGPA